MEIGEIVSFGPYEWLVLELGDQRALLITKDIIAQRPYHTDAQPITWESSEIRAYLNSDFLRNFTQQEQMQILLTKNKNLANEWYQTPAGTQTEDHVFLLSIEEVTFKYFGDSSRLLYQPGKNQRYWFQRKDVNNRLRQANYADASWWWWLRSPGRTNRTAVYVWGNGNIGIQGNGTYNYSSNTIHPLTKDNSGGVRPALWLKRT